MNAINYMSVPVSIRFDDALLERLRRRSRAVPGSTPSGLAQLLIDEGLRMAEHPGVAFKDGPTGRRAAVAFGPDVWEIITYLKEIDERGEAAIAAAAQDLSLPSARIRLALDYYSAFPDEIDQQVALADAASRSAQAAWQAQQRLLA
ncbi:MAG: hypothetical protein WCP28_17480 [Actinomycetes bacterium]